MIKLKFRRTHIVAVLWADPTFLTTLAVAREVGLRAWGARTFLGEMAPFALEAENCLTDWYSSLLLAFMAVLLFVMGHAETLRRWRPYWFSLAGIFVYLSIDEFVALHESLMGPMSRFHLTGAFGVAWVVPYGLACIVLAGVFLPFVLGQPASLRSQIILAGTIYLGSALGLEMVEAHSFTIGNMPAFRLSMMVQEVGEMIGLTIFAVALITDLSQRRSSIMITIADKDAVRSRAASYFASRSLWLAIYIGLMLFTAIFQIWWRSSQCEGMDCGLSFAKALIWSAIWPASWIVFSAGIQD